MLNLTRQERLVLIFIAAACLLGVGLNFFYKKNSSLGIEKIISKENPPSAINLNNASLNELASISSLGPYLAQLIIDFRQTHGPFKSLEELMLIKGLSQSKLNQIKGFLTIE